MPARLEHVNICVPDPVATAAVLERLFDWHIRWEGVSPGDGYSIHVGDTEGYVALYRPGHGMQAADPGRYRRWAGLNHVGVVVSDLDQAEARVRAEGELRHSMTRSLTSAFATTPVSRRTRALERPLTPTLIFFPP